MVCGKVYKFGARAAGHSRTKDENQVKIAKQQGGQVGGPLLWRLSPGGSLNKKLL